MDYDEVVEALQRVFGIAAICPVMRVEDLGFEELKNQVVSYIRRPTRSRTLPSR